MLGAMRASGVGCVLLQSNKCSSLGKRTLVKGEVLVFGYVVWPMYVGHRVWIWGDLKEDGWQGVGCVCLSCL